LNLEYNYWGNCSGPNSLDISGYVDYRPWLGICVDNSDYFTKCPVEGENINLYLNVTSETCIDEILFSVKTNGNWINFSGNTPSNGFGEYFAEVNSDLIHNGNLEWKVYSRDCYGNIYVENSSNIYLYPKTKLIINPSEPNGENSWYLLNPIFTLENPNASNIYYKWDSQEVLIYSGNFGFEDAPNNQNLTGGIIDLNYWSELNLCNRNESVTSKILKSDLTDPVIKELNPSEGSTSGILRPTISAYLDEVYGSNSGINVSSIIFKLDGDVVNPVVTLKDLDALVEYTPASDLSETEHNASIYVKDKSGRFSERTWKFNVKFVDNDFDLNVNSPKPGIYGVSKIPFNVSTSKYVKIIEYKSSSLKTWTKLCTNCNNYGNSSNKIKTLTEGWHNITIRTINDFGIVKQENISFLIDSKVPKIYSTSPRVNKFTDGSEFYVKFIEENPRKVNLVINKTKVYEVNMSDCFKIGRYWECYTGANLSEFEGKEIEYYFNVSDDLREGKSKSIKIKVDSLFPEIEVVVPEQYGNYSRRFTFEINVNESNLKSVSYIYEYLGREKEVVLCSKLTNGSCKVTKTLLPGEYEVIIKAEDKSGNVVGNSVEFEVK